LSQHIEGWLEIASRNLAMADALLENGFPEGAYFHLFHGFEAACCAALTALNLGALPPGGHSDRCYDAEDAVRPLDATLANSMANAHRQLLRRNQALYLGQDGQRPHVRFTVPQVLTYTKELRSLLPQLLKIA
jgi:hypothetical protein